MNKKRVDHLTVIKTASFAEMRVLIYLRIVIPRVCAAPAFSPQRCLYFGGASIKLLRTVARRLRDTVYHRVLVSRWQCEGCIRSFRIYPAEVTRWQFSARAKLRDALVLDGAQLRSSESDVAMLGRAE